MTVTCETPRQLENRGMMWMIGAFVFCPCHLPITLSALALLLGGTAAGVLLRAHPYIAAAIVTALWAAGTWRGYSLVRAAQRFAQNSRGTLGAAAMRQHSLVEPGKKD